MGGERRKPRPGAEAVAPQVRADRLDRAAALGADRVAVNGHAAPGAEGGRTPAAPPSQLALAAFAAAPVVVIVVVIVLTLDAQHLRIVHDVAADDCEHRVD